jgi:hypothetical protein
MAICGVVASESLLTYDRNPPGMPRTSRSLPVRSGGIAQGAQRAPVEYCHGPTMSALCAWHLTHS